MNSSRQRLLPLFLKEVQDGLPIIEDFLKGNDPERCDLGSLKSAFCATSTISGTARIVNAESIGKLAGHVERLLDKHLKNQTSLSSIEFDALQLAQEKIRALADCLSSDSPEPPGLFKGAQQALALAEAFPGRSSSVKSNIDDLVPNDPFAADALPGASDVDCRMAYSQEVPGKGICNAVLSFECPDDIFAEDDLIELSSDCRKGVSSAYRLDGQGGGSADPFEDDPVFDPVVF